ncbi:hypothetical protein ACG33_13230 [Steroidobacter denitrificans]|uniref:Uncharacterized protein n=2 Tax=Steroidobacter denitrificans TaxID=465721 RepID=A0A127FC96_STEDE|nr:hypothetical protein ACG33_13230 [Steroidobacter denitrificans]
MDAAQAFNGDHRRHLQESQQNRSAPQRAPMRSIHTSWICALAFTSWIVPTISQAMPALARQYNVSCVACHDAFPRLNAFGESFVANNFRMPNWRQTMMDLGDERLALPKSLPLAIRAQAFAQGREGKDIDPATGPTGNASSFDFQAPYLIKLLSSAPLSEHITFYFYAIFAEKGGNGETLIEDAWFRHDDVLGSGVGAQLGQFQISDLMFPREVRLTFQDFYAYRAAGITYDRGLILDRGLGPLEIAIGAVNGNGITQNFAIDSPGYRRPDQMFDNDSRKSLFGRVGFTAGGVNVGIFGLAGQQKSAAGFAGTVTGNRDTDKRILGLDLSGSLTPRTHWFAQGIWNEWRDFLDAEPQRDFDWFGGFVGVDHVHSDRWTFSLLYNYAEADDFRGTGTVFEGIKINSLSLASSYYFMRNLKGVIEVNADLLSKDPAGPPYVGHQTREHYLLIGFDAAY